VKFLFLFLGRAICHLYFFLSSELVADLVVVGGRVPIGLARGVLVVDVYLADNLGMACCLVVLALKLERWKNSFVIFSS